MANSASVQRQQILDWLQTKPLSTIEAREQLGIMHPGGRVSELRRQGHSIVTNEASEVDAAGKIHRVAKYVLDVPGV
ncbi:helix-turn-helix domain-containing protein [Nitrosomonas halophila]|uniref:Helix-turn-helix domain-containing protein n=1 Tax=Nitrosomonas halophila TaxID=44576 RepID=A0A1H3JFU8_9PROT|nr:helix-turn-helix domain-containing protein [Nitrosomonas halophila]SDY38094.1 Helix-turn-helix domain-containing protein [Nitrosomonas halophila]